MKLHAVAAFAVLAAGGLRQSQAALSPPRSDGLPPLRLQAIVPPPKDGATRGPGQADGGRRPSTSTACGEALDPLNKQPAADARAMRRSG